jgi:dihydrofolate synthase/folylpolyglutamate synthase
MKKTTTKKLVFLALLAALQVVFSKFLMVQATPSVRFSMDSVPILLAGLWFGPLYGAFVGLLGDALGTILFPTAGAWYPPLTLAYLLIGCTAGFLRGFVQKSEKLWRIAVLAAVSELIGSLLWKTLALSWLIGIPFLIQLSARVLPVCVNTLIDTLLVFALNRLLSPRIADAGILKPLKQEALPSTATMTYDEALSYIHSVTWRGSRLGLSRTRELLAQMGNPEEKLKFIHVAGTNGKGSTAAMLASILSKAGYRTGLYTSPFINRFNERMQVDGQDIPDDTLARLTGVIKPLADQMADHPTEFELITSIGFAYFLEEKCDVVVLEVGMGGELDSTNVIPVPELAVITNIGLDHTRELGPTITDIAKAKAGIIKEHGDVVIYGENAEADAVFIDVCRQRHANLHVTDHGRIANVRADLTRLTFDFTPLENLTCPLVGAYQPHNAAVALTAIEILREKGWEISDDAIYQGLDTVRWPARFEVLSRVPLFIADGGHNPQGVQAALDSIHLHFPGKKIIFLLGIMADKDVPAMTALIGPYAKVFVTVAPRNPRAMPAQELADRLTALGYEAIPCQSVEAGVEKVLSLAGPEDVICALGSLYMLGDVRSFLIAHS